MKSIYPFIQGKQPQIGKHNIFDAHKHWATCGRIQRDERWWWSTWKEECHLLLTKWNQFIPSQGKQPQIGKHIIFDADKNWATCGRIQRDERWWWSTWKEECHLLLTKENQFIPSSREGNRKSANASFWMRTKTEQPAVAFNATKDDDDLLEKKSVIFCWLNEINLSLHPGKATANRQTQHFWCAQTLSNLRSHSTRRKMMMIYLKRRVSSFAD